MKLSLLISSHGETIATVTLIPLSTMFLARYISSLNPFQSANTKPYEKKTQSKRATGAAFNTVKRRSKEHELKLFGSCYWYD